MAFDDVPWSIGGGAEHSAAVGRLLAYAATQGATGIIQPGDLRVKALSVPGGAVSVSPGAAVLLNRYSGAPCQSYMVRNESTTTLNVSATGSGGGATRYVIVRVIDPEFSGQIPADPNNYVYVKPELVNSINNLAYPHVVLAKIVQPANTGTITQAMITDLREVANPRRKEHVYPEPIITGDTGLTLAATGADGELFPNSGGMQSIYIPTWATRVQIRAEWLGIRLVPKSGWGRYWTEFGPYERPSTRKYRTQGFAWDADSSSDTYRTNWISHDDVYVDPSIRGTDQTFYMKARIDSGAKTPKIVMDALSGVVMSVTFLEVADPSDS